MNALILRGNFTGMTSACYCEYSLQKYDLHVPLVNINVLYYSRSKFMHSAVGTRYLSLSCCMLRLHSGSCLCCLLNQIDLWSSVDT